MNIKARVDKLAAQVERIRPGPPPWFTDEMCAKLCWAYGGRTRAGGLAEVRRWMAESPEHPGAFAPVLAVLEQETLPWEA
jgi:hypothetical protein